VPTSRDGSDPIPIVDFIASFHRYSTRMLIMLGTAAISNLRSLHCIKLRASKLFNRMLAMVGGQTV
jgi:hypothetical protein